jgi:hypothetical protein
MKKDLDESTNSIDVSSNEENNETLHANNTQVPAVMELRDGGAVLKTMATLDDVDDDEAFITELMAMHPNDDDILVEDLEDDGDLQTLHEALMTTEGLETMPEPPILGPPPDDDNDDGDGVRMNA